jgi:O-antigen/teichoic acid export membrane protein
MSISRVVARNTGFQVVGEIASRAASLALYAVMARELGKTGFGSFMVAFSIATLLVIVAGAGTESVLTRETARDRGAVHHLFWNAIGLKLVLGVVCIAVGVMVSLVGPYGSEVRLSVPLLGIAALIEVTSKSVYATFLGFDDMRPVATSLVLQRFITASTAIVALLLGAGVVAVSLLFVVGACVGLAYASRTLFVRVVRPRFQVSVAGTWSLLLLSAPIGMGAVFNAVLFRIDSVILSLYKSEAVVGLYGAAYRLLDATLFLTYAFVAALLPSFSRLNRTSSPTVGETYSSGVKILVAALFPIGTAFVLFAEPLLRVVYGQPFTSGATALRLLGGTVALYGFAYISASLLVGQDRQRVIPWVTGAVAVENVALNVALIPRYSLNGAAFATTITELTRATLMTSFAVKETGRISMFRVATGPVTGCAAMGLVALAFGSGLVEIPLAAAAYVMTLFAVERVLFPGDMRLLLDAVLRRQPVAHS